MNAPASVNLIPARAFLAAIWGILCSLIIAAPVLSLSSWPVAASLTYFQFSHICHQMPERSFFISIYPLAVCHRCTGIYLGFLLGSLFGSRLVECSARAGRLRIAAACVPMILDALASAAGIWAGSWPTRFSTGLLFGVLISPILIRGLAEFMRESAAQIRNIKIHEPKEVL